MCGNVIYIRGLAIFLSEALEECFWNKRVVGHYYQNKDT